MKRIGIYAHYHGSGHCSYANQIASYNVKNYVVFTSSDYTFLPEVDTLKLPDEDPTENDITSRTKLASFLHYNPQGNRKVVLRSALMISEIVRGEIDLLLVDVSVEIAMLARISSIPYAYCRMMGNRDDEGHKIAYQGAQFLYAFYPESFEPADTPDWIRNKTMYLGFTSPKGMQTSFSAVSENPKSILVMHGQGGNEFNQTTLEQIESQFPNTTIKLIGRYEGLIDTAQSTIYNFVDNPEEFITEADLIIASCGSNTVSLLLSMGKRFLAIPEGRPYDEQEVFSVQLESQGLCTKVYQDNFADAFLNLKNLNITNSNYTSNTAQKFSNLLVNFGVDAFDHYKNEIND